ncbi:hypothetical protein BYT27DRAFT_7205753 [Phlegmacium glaucopus]|nr:hypothetical protein BYT27DRAFT_7205753 [Phlegmacium glaucopus]
MRKSVSVGWGAMTLLLAVLLCSRGPTAYLLHYIFSFKNTGTEMYPPSESCDAKKNHWLEV